MNGIKHEHLETRHYFHNMFSGELLAMKKAVGKTSDIKNISLLVVIHETWKIIPENYYLQLPDQQNIGTPAFNMQTIPSKNSPIFSNTAVFAVSLPWLPDRITFNYTVLSLMMVSVRGECGSDRKLWNIFAVSLIWSSRSCKPPEFTYNQGNLMKFIAQRLPSQLTSHRTYLQAQSIFTISSGGILKFGLTWL